MSGLTYTTTVGELNLEEAIGKVVSIASADGDFIVTGILAAGPAWHTQRLIDAGLEVANLYGPGVSLALAVHLVGREAIEHDGTPYAYILSTDDHVAFL